MAIKIKHQFVSLKGDGGDATQVQPSYWNADHSFTLASGQLVGRLSAGVGAAEEIPISAFMANLLNTPDIATLAEVLGLFDTGDVKYTFKSTAPAGWYMMVGGTGTPPNQIGSAASGANGRANADTQALFILIYNSCSNTVAPVSGGRSGNALNDFNANKTITIPQLVGRVPIGAGVAATSTIARVIGTIYGAESTILETANLPPYTPAGTVNTGSLAIYNSTDGVQGAGSSQVVKGGSISGSSGTQSAALTQFSGFSFTGTPQGGSSQPVGILSPSTALNVMVKL